MTKKVTDWNLADAVADPTSVFSRPGQVVDLEELPKRDKLAILESWKALEEEMVKMHEQGDLTDVPSRLEAVKQAISDVA